MNLKIFPAVFFAMTLLSGLAYSEPVPDRLIGKVNVRNAAKLDAQAKKEIAAIAVKIRKSKINGSVKIIGDVPSAESQDEYTSKAIFLARNVETQIKPLLSGKYQVYIAVPKFSGEKRTGLNSVEIYLYPHELKVEGAGFISSQVTSEELPKERETVKDLPSPSSQTPPSDTGLLTAPVDDSEQADVTSKKERLRTETEDPALANELVNKAKARAAQKAKRLEQEK